ncbi:MAG: hypothetical protein QOF77_1167 [Solirubrobacteraceae bacterium]|jgi:DNA-binding CsgD family transcriptional regulator|nr:hypothetical protein [Solirubrobacteraceae bacterium]
MTVGPPPGDLLERDDELGRLKLVCTDIARGGGVAIVEGPAGIGKTRLLAEAVASLEGGPAGVLTARASEMERRFPLGVVCQLLEPRLAGADETERRALLAGPARLAGSVLGGVEHEQPAEASFGVMHGLYWLLANLAARQPVVLAVDDVQWSDGASLRFLLHLARRLGELPIVVLLALRTGETATGPEADMLAELRTDAGATLVRPRPLSPSAAARLLELELGTQPDSAFVAACHLQTRGNPWLLHELMLILRADDVAPSTENVDLVARCTPRVLSDAILLRLRRLPPGAEALARAAAVLGDGAALIEAAELAALEPERAAAAASALMRADILDASRGMAFTHPLVRSAILLALHPGELALWHARAADILVRRDATVERIAAHLMESDPAANPRNVDLLRAAARTSLARGANNAAQSLLERALREPPAPTQRAALVADLGMSALLADQAATAARHLREAWELAGDPTERAGRVVSLARALLASAGPQAATGLLEGAVGELADAERELRLDLEAELAAMAVYDVRSSRRLWRRLDGFADLRGETPAERRVLAVLAVRHQYEGTFPAAAVSHAAGRAYAGGKLVHEGATDAMYWAYAMSALASSDAVGELESLVATARAHCRRIGWIDGYAIAASGMCLSRLRDGRLDEAEEEGRTVIAAFADLEATPMRLIVRNAAVQWTVEVLLERGAVDAAGALLARYGLDEDTPRDVQTVNIAFTRALLHLARGEPGRAIDHLAHKRAVEAASGWIEPGTPWRALAAEAHAQLGEREPARKLADEQYAIARRWGLPRELGIALRARARVEAPAARAELLSEAVDCLTGSNARLELAKSLVELGVALRQLSRRVAARELLQRGADLAAGCGAGALADRAVAELRLAGARPRRRTFRGIDSLTAAERRVSEMAAQQMTNREIAGSLFVTQKTVESQLTSAYAKLGVRNRAELSAALAAAPAGTPHDPAPR